MHYGAYAFRNKEWGSYLSQATRTIFPSPLSLAAIKVSYKLFPFFVEQIIINFFIIIIRCRWRIMDVV